MKVEKKQKNNLGGFSLLEMIIAIFIFSLIITTSVAVFASVISTRKKARDVQSNMESARTVLELMAKNMRNTQELQIIGSDQVVKMFNYTQGKCIYYKFDLGKLNMGEAPKNCGPVLPLLPCSSSNPPCPDSRDASIVYTEITSGGATGSFHVDQTNCSPPNPRKIGKVTVRMNIGGQDLQTSVSLADYVKENQCGFY